jgi:hypothetical protein
MEDGDPARPPHGYSWSLYMEFRFNHVTLRINLLFQFEAFQMGKDWERVTGKRLVS